MIPALFLLLPLLSGNPEIHVVADIPYTRDGSYKHQLDLVVPSGNRYPVVVFVHGGSLISGDRKGYPGVEPYGEIARNLARYGIGCALVSYRLGPDNKWPTMAEDVAAAFAWTRRNIAAYGGDSTRVYLAGHSSGAHIVSVVASDDRFLKEAGCSLKDVSGCIAISTSLHPSFDIDNFTQDELDALWRHAEETRAYESVFHDPSDYRDADPFYHVNAGMPRFLIMFGEDEAHVTPALDHADLFTGKLARVGVRSDVEVIENRTHLSILQHMAEEGDPAVLLLARFVNRR